MKCEKCGTEYEGNFCPNGCNSVATQPQSKKPIYKKWWFWVIIVIVVVGVAGSIGSGTANEDNISVQPAGQDNVNVEETPTEKTKAIKIGEKIVTDNMEITLNKVELTYDVLPDDTSGFYTHYQAEQGEVYISIDIDVYNKAKQNLPCDEIGKVTANYNNGYKYSGYAIVKDSSTGFTYANITNITPLETRGMKWLISCPQEVETSTHPLVLTFTIEGKDFTYTVR